MTREIIIAGFGGQGVMSIGKTLTEAGLKEGHEVSWVPSYGPEMRGGTANCTVILSEEEIGAPIIHHPTIAVVLNLPSMEKYEPLVKPGGLLIVNSSLIPMSTERQDIRSINVAASDIATELGNPRMANMVILGALIGATQIVSLETVARQLDEHLSQRQRKWLEPNIAALKKGAELGK